MLEEDPERVKLCDMLSRPVALNKWEWEEHQTIPETIAALLQRFPRLTAELVVWLIGYWLANGRAGMPAVRCDERTGAEALAQLRRIAEIMGLWLIQLPSDSGDGGKRIRTWCLSRKPGTSPEDNPIMVLLRALSIADGTLPESAVALFVTWPQSLRLALSAGLIDAAGKLRASRVCLAFAQPLAKAYLVALFQQLMWSIGAVCHRYVHAIMDDATSTVSDATVEVRASHNKNLTKIPTSITKKSVSERSFEFAPERKSSRATEAVAVSTAERKRRSPEARRVRATKTSEFATVTDIQVEGGRYLLANGLVIACDSKK